MKAKMKRFYQDVETASIEQDGKAVFQILLDGRVLKTPEQHPLLLENQKLAEQIALEWQSVEEDIVPAHMPLFSSATTVIDRVTPQADSLREQLADYLENDLICYRAPIEEPELRAYQQAHWDEWLAWIRDEFGIELATQSGIMPVSQSGDLRARCASILADCDDWQLSCLVRATQLCGSFVLAWAFICTKIDADRLFELSFLEELFQNKRWGLDEEAERRQHHIKSELKDISAFFEMLKAT